MTISRSKEVVETTVVLCMRVIALKTAGLVSTFRTVLLNKNTQLHCKVSVFLCDAYVMLSTTLPYLTASAASQLTPTLLR